jgi:SagB-type dehydrogenase family enzyme
MRSFHEIFVKTKFFPHFSNKFFQIINSFNQSGSALNTEYKSYPLNKSRELQAREDVGLISELNELFEKRSSVIQFAERDLRWQTLSNLLLGLQRETRDRPNRYIIPSAGNRKSLELYFWANRVEGLDKGVYHYDIKKKSVVLVSQGVGLEQIKEIFPGGSEDIANCSGIFFVTSIYDKAVQKYRNRSLRFIFIEAGMYLDRLWILANGLGLQGSILGGGYDDAICKILKINSLEEGPLASFILGHGRASGVPIKE